MPPTHQPESECLSDRDLDLSFKVYHELMAKRVSEILLVSSPYDAFIMEEDGRLTERIIHEYRGLNLTRPPKLTWVSSAAEALRQLSYRSFDLMLTMPRLDDMNPDALGQKVKKIRPNLPVVLLTHDTAIRFMNRAHSSMQHKIDQFFVWSGNTDLLLAIIKNIEDQQNVTFDTQRAQVRVIILVEDSPKYRSSILPLLYREIVLQTQKVIEESLNEEHRILKMRVRPKIVLAENYEHAVRLFNKHKPYLLSIFSDVRFPRKGVLDSQAGFALLEMVKKEIPGMPLLVLSSEETNRKRALALPAVFVNKNSPTLHTDIRDFFIQYLAFGDFIFRLPDGKEVGRAANLRAMEKILPNIPDESVCYHALRNHFSTWLIARSEIQLAFQLQPVRVENFENSSEIKPFLIDCLKKRRKRRQTGVVTDFVTDWFDPEADFVKIGKGSLGGKARGLAFISTLLKPSADVHKKFDTVTICVPKTVVISTDGFDRFIVKNDLKKVAESELTDSDILTTFFKARFPDDLYRDLDFFLSQVHYPLAVRSSSLLEDAQYQPYAGLYKTCMIPNNHPDQTIRLKQLIHAIKTVYASTYFEAPRAFAQTTLHRIEEEKMAVIVQEVIGRPYGNYFYPAISGVAQSYNFYPISYMKPEEGIAHIALGLGKIVVEGGKALRFSPHYPQLLPQFASVDDILRNSQKYFFGLKMDDLTTEPDHLWKNTDMTLVRRDIGTAVQQRSGVSLNSLLSTYIPDEHRIRDTWFPGGHYVLTFANILKHRLFPLPEILQDILDLGRKGMGAPVEIEFAVNLYNEIHSQPQKAAQKPVFALLQIRPMILHHQSSDVDIPEADIQKAWCYSENAMGHGEFRHITDIVYVKPAAFDAARTQTAAAEIGKINHILLKDKCPYLLIGPGRWGSADRFLGIPVQWNDISGVGAIVETSCDQIHADPSQGTHFFHNITSLGISYITLAGQSKGFIRTGWFSSLPSRNETEFIRHIKTEVPLIIKINGKTSRAVILSNENGG